MSAALTGDGALDRLKPLADAIRADLEPFRAVLEASISAEDALKQVERVLAQWDPIASAREVEAGLQIAAAEGAVHGKVRG